MKILKKVLKVWLKMRTKTPFFRLVFQSSGHDWESAETHLFDFNKTIITLSSSILVVSFSLIKLASLRINKTLLGWSWGLFVFTIACGVILLFLRFISRFTDRIIESQADKGNYKIPDLLTHEEIGIYFSSIFAMYLLSFIELLGFLAGMILLVYSAYNAL